MLNRSNAVESENSPIRPQSQPWRLWGVDSQASPVVPSLTPSPLKRKTGSWSLEVAWVLRQSDVQQARKRPKLQAPLLSKRMALMTQDWLLNMKKEVAWVLNWKLILFYRKNSRRMVGIYFHGYSGSSVPHKNSGCHGVCDFVDGICRGSFGTEKSELILLVVIGLGLISA